MMQSFLEVEDDGDKQGSLLRKRETSLFTRVDIIDPRRGRPATSEDLAEMHKPTTSELGRDESSTKVGSKSIPELQEEHNASTWRMVRNSRGQFEMLHC